MFSFFKRKPAPTPTETFEVRQQRRIAALNARTNRPVASASARSSSTSSSSDDTMLIMSSYTPSYSSDSCSSSSNPISWSFGLGVVVDVFNHSSICRDDNTSDAGISSSDLIPINSKN